jgi:hypothetical protein
LGFLGIRPACGTVLAEKSNAARLTREHFGTVRRRSLPSFSNRILWFEKEAIVCASLALRSGSTVHQLLTRSCGGQPGDTVTCNLAQAKILIKVVSFIVHLLHIVPVPANVGVHNIAGVITLSSTL